MYLCVYVLCFLLCFVICLCVPEIGVYVFWFYRFLFMCFVMFWCFYVLLRLCVYVFMLYVFRCVCMLSVCLRFTYLSFIYAFMILRFMRLGMYVCMRLYLYVGSCLCFCVLYVCVYVFGCFSFVLNLSLMFYVRICF